jgi:hypothetical protein
VATGFHGGAFRCFRHTSHEAFELLFIGRGNREPGGTFRLEECQSLDTPALGRLAFRQVAPQRPRKSPVAVTDSRRVAS